MKTSNGNGMSREQKARWDGNASRAMQGLIAQADPLINQIGRCEVADMAYDFADEMEASRKEHLANWEKPDASE